MQSYIAKNDDILNWIKKIAEDKIVYFPQKHGMKNFRWEQVTAKSELSFGEYIPSISPPIKKVMPLKEELFRYKNEGDSTKVEAVIDSTAQVLVGVRPCDLKSFLLMDKAMLEDVDDQKYKEKRDNTTLVLYRCESACDDNCFCQTTGSLDETRGADVILTPIDGQIAVEAKSEKGEALVKGVTFSEADSTDTNKKYLSKRPKDFGRQILADVNTLPDTLKSQWDSDVWKKYIEKCYSCGSCNLVCPTCYCFSVSDDIELDCVSGCRTRSADGCMLPSFAIVAGDHNFRGKEEQRQRHRVNRKFNYLMKRFNEGSVCVGCGRCGRQCTAKIDIFDIVNDIIKEGGK